MVSTITAAKGSLELLSCLLITPAGEEKPALRGPVVPCSSLASRCWHGTCLFSIFLGLLGFSEGLPEVFLPSPSLSLPSQCPGSPACPKVSVSSWTLLIHCLAELPPALFLHCLVFTLAPLPPYSRGPTTARQPSVYCFLSGSSFAWHTNRYLTNVLYGHKEWVIRPPLKATALYSVLILSRRASYILTSCPCRQCYRPIFETR